MHLTGRRGTLLRRAVFGLIVLVAFAYGAAVGVYHLPPFDLLQDVQDLVARERPENAVTREEAPQTPLRSTPSTTPADTAPAVPPELRVSRWARRTDPRRIVGIRSLSDIAAKREALVAYLWRGNGFPSDRVPDS